MTVGENSVSPAVDRSRRDTGAPREKATNRILPPRSRSEKADRTRKGGDRKLLGEEKNL
jgi:hypothetical protein